MRPGVFSTAALSATSPGEMIWRVKLSNCAAISELFASASGTPELSAVDTVL